MQVSRFRGEENGLQDEIERALGDELGVIAEKHIDRRDVFREQRLDVVRGPGQAVLLGGTPMKVLRRPQQRHKDQRVVRSDAHLLCAAHVKRRF